MIRSIGKFSVALSALTCAALLILSSCSKNALFPANGNLQASTAVSGSNLNPVMRILSPANGESFSLGDSVFFQVVVGDSYPDSAFTWRGVVSFYRNSVLIATDSSAPYACMFKASALGQSILVAKAVSGGTIVAY